jgi:hypothetical protein
MQFSLQLPHYRTPFRTTGANKWLEVKYPKISSGKVKSAGLSQNKILALLELNTVDVAYWG